MIEEARRTRKEPLGKGAVGQVRPVLRLRSPLVTGNGDEATIGGVFIRLGLRERPLIRGHSPRRGVPEIVVRDDDEIEPGHIAGVSEIVVEAAFAIRNAGMAMNVTPIDPGLSVRRPWHNHEQPQRAQENWRASDSLLELGMNGKRRLIHHAGLVEQGFCWQQATDDWPIANRESKIANP